MDTLRKAAAGSSRPWTMDELRAGFLYFKQVEGRFPTAHEIDSFPYLPTSRSIQRAYGGLVGIRKQLFPNEISDYTKGAYRSSIAKATSVNGKEYEAKFYDYLIEYFEEIAVHEQKVIRPGNVSSDFFIYLNEETGVVIDIFFANSMLNFINIVNLKIKRYSLVGKETYLIVVGNAEITQTLINQKVANRRVPLPHGVEICSEEYFKQEIVPSLQLRSSYRR